MHCKNTELKLDKSKFVLAFLGLFVLTGFGNGCTLLNSSQYDKWRDEEMKREIKDVDRAIQQADKTGE